MARPEMIRSYLEKLLSEGFGQPIEPDQDGDYPLRGDGSFYARLIEPRGNAPAVVQIFAVAVRDVAATPELLTAINDLNANVVYARVFHVGEQVLVETDLVADTIEPQEVGVSCNVVGSIAAAWGPRLSSQFGGTSPFAQLPPEEVPERGPAGYL